MDLKAELKRSVNVPHGIGTAQRTENRRVFCCRSEAEKKMDPEMGLIEQSFDSRYSQWVREALDGLPESFTITDPCISGHPIVYASRGFLKMSGYLEEEVVGRNGRVFQGPATDRRSVMEIREAVRGERAVQVSLLNYRKDGSAYWVLFQMCPVFSKEDGRVTHFVAVQVPVSRKARRSGNGFGRSEVGFCEDIVFGSCRREVCKDSLVELGRVLAVDSDDRGLEIEESCEAAEQEKRKAMTAIHNIFSVLTHYSELTGRLVCAKRCSVPGVGLLASSLNISLGRIKQSFVLTDPHLPDMPIVYASDAFLKLTGYARHEVLGQNFGFLNGEDTDPETVHQVMESIRNEQACTVRILNYRKDGSSFWNLLHMSPVRNASGKVAYIVGAQQDEGGRDQDKAGLSPAMRQHSVIGAVKVAVRTLSMGAGTSRS